MEMQRLDIVDTINKFDENHTQILSHRKKRLLKGLQLPFLSGVTYFCHFHQSFTEHCNFLTKLLLYIVKRDLRIFYHIM